LLQNGIIFGDTTQLAVIDAKIQPNGDYLLRQTTYSSDMLPANSATSLLQTVTNLVTTDDPTLVWTPLISEVKTIHWKFEAFNNATNWTDAWTAQAKPNVVEFNYQQAADSQPTTMEFWITPIVAPALAIPTDSNETNGVNGFPNGGRNGRNGGNGNNGNGFNGNGPGSGNVNPSNYAPGGPGQGGGFNPPNGR
jgi:hypothetical protein